MTHDAAKYDAEAAKFLGALPEWCSCGMWRVHTLGDKCVICIDDARVANTAALAASHGHHDGPTNQDGT